MSSSAVTPARTKRAQRALIAAKGAGAIAALALVAAAAADAVPWPFGPPSQTQLEDELIGALELYEAERLDEILAAQNPADETEHVVVNQSVIDKGNLTNRGLFIIGDALFEHAFQPLDGHGSAPSQPLRRVHDGLLGGLDTFSCAGCHSVGGPNGAGSLTQNALLFGDGDDARTTLVRNSPHVMGLGFVQAIAYEMSGILYRTREDAVEAAVATGGPQTVLLQAKGVDFGKLTAQPDGSIDASEVEGVSPDLIVRPFGWKGDIPLLRRFVEDAARVHFGVQSEVLKLKLDPELLGDGPAFDPDNDGVEVELREGSLTAGAVYLALLEVPVIIPPADPAMRQRWARGSALFDELGCASCHRRTLSLSVPIWEEFADTTGGKRQLNLFLDGEEPRGTNEVELFSDLKRHDMGAENADAFDHPMGIDRREFLTRPLWGLAETAPYMHDGRALTIPDAIAAHGGDAQASRDAFVDSSEAQQQDLHVFLLSLTRTPKLRIPR